VSWRWLPVLALASACGDNLSGGPVDGGAIDARHFADASRAACEPDAGCGDEPLTPVCDAERGICVECLAEIDCAREQAFGPRCDESAGYCQCADDSECEGNPNGPWCNQVVHACTCLLDEDCGGDTTCEMEPYLGGGVRACGGQAREIARHGREVPSRADGGSVSK
jgi:hypothetical protein